MRAFLGTAAIVLAVLAAIAGVVHFAVRPTFLKVAVSSHQSLVLSQVLRPRFDDERFDVLRRMLSIAIDAPP